MIAKVGILGHLKRMGVRKYITRNKKHEVSNEEFHNGLQQWKDYQALSFGTKSGIHLIILIYESRNKAYIANVKDGSPTKKSDTESSVKLLG